LCWVVWWCHTLCSQLFYKVPRAQKRQNFSKPWFCSGIFIKLLCS
jgi:hypothetical protein